MKLTNHFSMARAGFCTAAFVALISFPAHAALPARCLDIKIGNPSAPDGTYLIFPNNQAFQVYCRGMATSSPAEYLTLVNTGTGVNFSQFTAGGAAVGTDIVTLYTKVRLDPATLLVDTGDQTYAASTGFFTIHGIPLSFAPYANAGDCADTGSSTGRANVDLRGTPFYVNDTFVLVGFEPAGLATFSSANQVVNLTGGGYCGGLEAAPGTGGFVLNLGFNGPTVLPIAIKPGSNPATIVLKSAGNIPVAILSTDTFDASQVNAGTVTFGKNGTEASPVHSALQDVNADGKLDLILQFQTQQTGFQCGDSLGLMKITTSGNQQYLGVGTIQTVCK